MAEACADVDGAMTAVLGGDQAQVLSAIDRAGCVAANVNGAGQVVAAGPKARLEQLAADPPAGARLRPLAVAGPFHSPWMAAAREQFAAAVDADLFAAQHQAVISNLDGAVVTSGEQLAERLVVQVTAPVRFDLCMRTMRDSGVTAAIELVPGGVLGGLLRRELPDVEVVTLRSPADLDTARALVHEHLPVGERLAADWRVVVAPARGTFHPAEATGAATGVLGVVSNRGRDITVSTHGAHVLVEWLAADGDPVAQGQPVARVQLVDLTERVGAR